MRKAALILDPEWRTGVPQFPKLEYWIAHVKTQLGQLIPIDFLLTAVSRDDEYLVTNLFENRVTNSNYVPHSVSSPHFAGQGLSRWSRERWTNYKIMSNKLTETDKKTKQNIPVSGRILTNTIWGLVNINASNDAINRMLTNTRHKIDEIWIIDPFQNIQRGVGSNSTGVLKETETAYQYAVRSGITMHILG